MTEDRASADVLQSALAAATDTRVLTAGTDVLGRTGSVFAEAFGTPTGLPSAQLIADGNTWAVAGEQVGAALRQAGVGLGEPFIFPAVPTVYASYDNVERIREHLRAQDGVPVVIGSGTLNDLVKLAAWELEREYLVVATAASMDGYAAYGASITKGGFKITRYCPAPAAIVADYGLLAAAPGRLTATGVGDLVEKIPAGGDWILADALDIETIDDDVWHLVQDPLRDSIAHPELIAAGDAGAIRGLSEGLLMSGLAMQAHQSSRPASGAGHQFSHLWEMEGLGLDEEPPLSHGMKVGLGTISLCALYEVALNRDLATLDVEAAVAAWPTWEQMETRVRGAALPPEVTEAAVEQSRLKYLAAPELRARLERLRDLWPGLAQRLRAQLLPAADIQHRLATVGAITHPSQIGVEEARFRATYVRAQMIRSRYTLLDVLLEANLLEECVAELFAPGGFWGSQPWRRPGEVTN
ncbi:sn-glycerol-1-phosphate dehydrogenase [Pseudactinotalea sp. Z1739]|uniref:sn-glycerol-1-phosphate dehydrogenase n=1 Tax=Pseudactinotalea sp. Z1739 TaxID=3413028 RepID=UPI003C7D55CD